MHFAPGVRFYFKYDTLFKHPGVKQDGYHALKIKDALNIREAIEAIIVPEAHRDIFEPLVDQGLQDKVHYLKNDCEDIWAWSEKVYDYILTI